MNPQERELYRKNLLAQCPRDPFGEMECGHACCPVVNDTVSDVAPLWECQRINRWRIFLWTGRTPEDIVKFFERYEDDPAGNSA